MGARQKIRIATHVEVTWLDAAAGQETVCPNCNFAVAAKKYLDIDYRPPDAVHHFILQICPHCGVRFTDNPETMDYANDQLIEIGWHTYQTQIGAGVWPIAAPLTRIAKPPGARVLEIGGAYGFGLDFCIRARGWTGEGFDPSPLAEYGARELGLNIEQDYFTEAHLARGPYDLVIATEVIEHLAHPPEFLCLMRRALTADGILHLSTPDAEWITPEQDNAQLMTLLSPGAHVVLQTAESLRTALKTAGFLGVLVERSNATLVAYASALPFTLDDDPAIGRTLYRSYLVARSKISAPGSDLQLGFAGRGFFEAVNDADAEAAADAWAALLPAVRNRFGFDLETLDALPEAAATASLAELARLIPLGLGMILFGRAMQLLGAGTSRAAIVPLLRLALAGAEALQKALASRSLSDGLSANIRMILQAEIAISLAAAGRPEAVQALIGLKGEAAVNGVSAWRGFIELINAGAYDLAKALQIQLELEWPATPHTGTFANMTLAIRHDALAALLLLDIAMHHEFAWRQERIALLQEAQMDDERLRDLTFASFVTMVNTAQFKAAASLFPTISAELRTLRSPYSASTRNAIFASGILALQTQAELVRAVSHFARLRDDLLKHPAPNGTPGDLFWPALRGEIIALGHLRRKDEAAALLIDFAATVPGMPADLVEMLPAGATIMQSSAP